MSIYKANNEPLVLTESDADAFLESVGVKLFEDTIAINGTVYEGTYGESILESNGIFLYEDGIVLEGKTKEEYEREKAAMRQTEKDNWENRYQKRMGDRNIRSIIVPKDRPHYADRTWNDDDRNCRNNYDVTSGGVEHNRVRNSPNLSPSQKLKHAADQHRKHSDAHQSVSKTADKRAYENKWANDNQKVNPINTKFNLAYATDAKARHDRKQAKKYAKPKNESTIFSDIEII